MGSVENAFAEQGGASSSSGDEFTSFLSYELRPAHFQESFSDIIRLITAGNSKSRAASLEQALKIIQSRKSTESRGRLDVLFFLEGYAQEKLGKTDAAATAYGKAVQLRSQNPLYLFRHAYVLKALGKCDTAATEFQQIAWQVKQAGHEPMFLAAECLEKLGKVEDAKRLYQEASKRNPLYAPVIKKMLVQYREELTKTFEPAPRLELENKIKLGLENVVRQDAGDRDCALELAELYLSGQRPTVNASAVATKAADLARTFVTKSSYKDDKAIRLLFLAETRLGRQREAAALLKRGLEANPRSSLLAGLSGTPPPAESPGS